MSFSDKDDIELLDRTLAEADYTELEKASVQHGFN